MEEMTQMNSRVDEIEDFVKMKFQRMMTNQDREVIKNTRLRVKIKSKLTNLVKISRIEGYNGKYWSNPQEIREISDDRFEFDQIKR